MTLPLLAQLNPNDPISLGLLIVGVVFISAWLLMRIRKRSVHGPDHPTARENLERYKQQDGVRNDLEGLMVEIEQLAKRLGNQLDTKSMRLEKLIDEADLRIAQLQKAMRDEHGKLPDAGPAPAAGEPTPKPASPEAITKQLSEVVESPLTTEAQTQQLTDEVARLADAGKSAEDIAKQLGEHVGKIELILALRKS
ncbi:hypothetical protein [Algisphaera agarilytica]|uniref:DUF2802 domain-containing protein n=1 Tax=Algisphaera agarilytica TaxID=1385975 RepID=A0A7X0H6I5_9BACT|nr:hypothetical protein [Algisphaera agarilytica]MBB6430226.1 hypothetical protein [Algisphaera agarilytica]